MATLFHVLLLLAIIIPSSSSSSSSSLSHSLTRGSSLYVNNKDDLLVSLNGRFMAGFHNVGENAYGFAVWFREQATVVWMANRDAIVNGKDSKLSLQEDGNLVLIDAGLYVIWSTNTKSTSSSIELQLHGTGNLVLHNGEETIWQSFDYPTNTLLPNQPFTKNTQLVSSRSSTNHSLGFYKFFFDSENVLRLLYDGPETTTLFWPNPSSKNWDAGRFNYQYTGRASLDSNGQFNSSDGFSFTSADFGMGPQRMMKIDTDGNLRVYSMVDHGRIMKWEVQWQAFSHSCKIHGVCGPNSICTHSQDSGRKCTCLHGYKMVKSEDWSYGCEPKFQLCVQDECDFIEIPKAEFFGYDLQMKEYCSLDACKMDCLQNNACMGFQFGWIRTKRSFICYTKSSLQNGYQMGYNFSMYIKLPKKLVSSFHQKTISQETFSCPSSLQMPIIRSYEKKYDNTSLGSLLVFGCVIGFIEIICILLFFWYGSRENSSTTKETNLLTATTFRRFTYGELKKASHNFSEEIGRGGACIVYKGRLSDNRIAAIKRIQNTNHQGEAEFQGEINTIGRLNHMNLMETWGYCAEGKHRLVVYEYMENGSLAKNLGLGTLDWATRLEIAIGTAKGLAYLHEECLEWVLHCDVKPHNILLDSNYKPKVADFGLSKLLDRCGIEELDFSMIRGTRGYMAPEWVLNLPITSKVDVFSYGVVILEMITGRSPAGRHHTSNEHGNTEILLIDWVIENIQDSNDRKESWVEKIVDPSISGKYHQITMEKLVRIALHCVKEDRETRPSMSEVVNMLLDE